MGNIAICTEDVSKRYRIGPRERYRTLRDSLTDALYAPFRSMANGIRRVPETKDHSEEAIWALKDVSFEIKHGEVVGIIGRNGAGKSTLLKVLSRITEPTEGLVRIRGRVGSLLEVGTGFHPELTGRENIHLSGAILGMKRVEIERKFDEIVSFAEIEKFVDTPVKHYSSGMYVRLAFAVAAHLEPEILLVDEVLSVGDAAFQKKSLGRMGNIAKEGRTVLFVSHNMASIGQLCSRALLFSSGHLVEDGDAARIVNDYLSVGAKETKMLEWNDRATAPGSDLIKLRSVRVLDHTGQVTSTFRLSDPVYVELTYWLLRSGLETNAACHLYSAQGIMVFASMDFHDREWLDTPKGTGIFKSVCVIPGEFLNEGTYVINVAVALAASPKPEVFVEAAAAFELIDDGQSEVRGRFVAPWTVGVLRPKLQWKTMQID